MKNRHNIRTEQTNISIHSPTQDTSTATPTRLIKNCGKSTRQEKSGLKIHLRNLFFLGVRFNFAGGAGIFVIYPAPLCLLLRGADNGIIALECRTHTPHTQKSYR